MHPLNLADPEVRRQCRRVERLATDLARIRRGEFPTAEELAMVPLIGHWCIGSRAEPALFGRISDHPEVEGPGLKSGLYLLDPERGFERTLGRFYRLGSEATP
jgi:hypothetical protein